MVIRTSIDWTRSPNSAKSITVMLTTWKANTKMIKAIEQLPGNKTLTEKIVKRIMQAKKKLKLYCLELVLFNKHYKDSDVY